MLFLFSFLISFSQNSDISKNVSEKFNENEIVNDFNRIAKSLNFKSGELIKIRVIFEIDENGNVINIKASGPHPYFEKEAIRLVESLPKMEPAIKNGVPISVKYSLPINFKIETEAEERKRLKNEERVKFKEEKRKEKELNKN